MDIGFALSAHSAYAPENFEKMKDFIHSIVDQYSIGRVKYGLVVYGADAEGSFDFQREFPKDEDLHRSLELLRPVKGGSNLEEGLKKDQELFTANGTRPNAHKVLVVFTDSKSTGDSKRAEAIAKKLKDDNIKVIAVGLGGQSDLNELDDVATDRRHVIPAKRTDDTEQLTKDVMALAFEGIGCDRSSIFRPIGSLRNRGWCSDESTWFPLTVNEFLSFLALTLNLVRA